MSQTGKWWGVDSEHEEGATGEREREKKRARE